jgi:hypothetical protein
MAEACAGKAAVIAYRVEGSAVVISAPKEITMDYTNPYHK